MFYSNKSSILVSGEGNSSRSKMTSFMRILNLKRIVFLMCIVSSWEITWGTGNDKTAWKEKIKVEKLVSGSEEGIDYYCNVVLLGDSKVGKTRIIHRYINGSFKDQYEPTLWINLLKNGYKSTINEDNSQTIQLNILDTAGQERLKTTVLSYINYARAIVLVYDVNQKDSFEHIDDWLKSAKGKVPQDAVYFLVGNKTDLNERQIQTAVAEQYAKNNNMQFFEVSAKGNNNLNKLFEDIVKECLIKDKDIINAIQNNKCCICCSCCPCNK